MSKPFTDEDVERVAEVLHRFEPLAGDVLIFEDCLDLARLALETDRAALAEAGRLQPQPTSEREEWAVLVRKSGGFDLSVLADDPENDGVDHEWWARERAKQDGGCAVRRIVRTHVGEWVEVGADLLENHHG